MPVPSLDTPTSRWKRFVATRKACATSPGQRVGRGVGAVVLGFVALGMLDVLWCAVPMLVCASCLAFSAITGWCPISFSNRPPAPRTNAFGYVDATRFVGAGTDRGN